MYIDHAPIEYGMLYMTYALCNYDVKVSEVTECNKYAGERVLALLDRGGVYVQQHVTQTMMSLMYITRLRIYSYSYIILLFMNYFLSQNQGE